MSEEIKDEMIVDDAVADGEEDILADAEAMNRGAKGDKDAKKKPRRQDAALEEANKKSRK